MKQILPKILHMRMQQFWFTGLFLLLLTGMANAQNGASVTGVVKDASGGPLPGVSVKIENKSRNYNATIATNVQGMFSATGIPPGGGYTFTFTSIGYKTKVLEGYTINLLDKLSIAVDLEEDATKLDDVVITALGN